MEFLKNLDRLMSSRNINKTNLAKACGISVAAVNSWWNRGYENISMKTLIKLSKYFNCTIDEIVYGKPKQTITYTSNEFSEEELKLINMYANYLKVLRAEEL